MTEAHKNPVGRPNARKKISGIYALLDPRDNGIKYIGQSVDIKSRYNGHYTSKSDYPVSLWCQELRSLNLKPILQILELNKNPIDIEKKWIDSEKLKGTPLLNLHGGGKNSWFVGGKSCRIWIDSNNFSPYKEYLRMYMMFLISKTKVRDIAKKKVDEAKALRATCKTEQEEIAFQIYCAKNLLENRSEIVKKKVHDWAIEVQKKVNEKYPNLFQIEYV